MFWWKRIGFQKNVFEEISIERLHFLYQISSSFSALFSSCVNVFYSISIWYGIHGGQIERSIFWIYTLEHVCDMSVYILSCNVNYSWNMWSFEMCMMGSIVSMGVLVQFYHGADIISCLNINFTFLQLKGIEVIFYVHYYLWYKNIQRDEYRFPNMRG